jgi:hypothetical protein
VIKIIFDDDVEDFFARQQVNNLLRNVNLPEDVSPDVQPPYGPTGEIFRYTLESKRSSTDLLVWQDWVIDRQLRSVPGVADIVSFGGARKIFEVIVNPNKLAGYNITPIEVYESIQKIINHGNILESLSLDYKELNEDERKIFMLSPNEIIAPIISQESLIGFVVIGESNSGDKYQTYDIEFITLLMNVSSNILVKMYNQEKIQKELNEVNYKKEKIELLNSFSSEILKFKNYKDLIESFIDILRKFEINEKVSVYAIDSYNNYKLIYYLSIEIFQLIRQLLQLKQVKDCVAFEIVPNYVLAQILFEYSLVFQVMDLLKI